MMTKAYICDKCGVILSSRRNVKTIYTTNPEWCSSPSEAPSIDLCETCYAEFEREYLKNLTEEGGDA